VAGDGQLTSNLCFQFTLKKISCMDMEIKKKSFRAETINNIYIAA